MPFVANISTPVPANLSVEVLSNYSAVRGPSYQIRPADGLQMADALADAAQVTAEAFTELNHSVNAFSVTFQPFALAQKVEDQPMVDQLNAAISALQVKIAG
jgi:hypothetical protein